MDRRIQSDVEQLHARIAEAECELNEKIIETRRIQKEDHESVSNVIESHHQNHIAEEGRLQSHCDDGLAKAAKDLTRVNDALLQELAKEAEYTTSRFEEVKTVVQKKDGDVNFRIDELTKMTETTFTGVDGRMEEMMRAFRARLGLVEKDVVEKTNG